MPWHQRVPVNPKSTVSRKVTIHRLRPYHSVSKTKERGRMKKRMENENGKIQKIRKNI